MMTLDAVGFIIAIVGLLGGFIVFLKYVSERPTRDEMKQEIRDSVGVVQKSVDDLKTDVKNEMTKFGGKLDKIIDRQGRRK